MAQITVWGVINKDGSIANGSKAQGGNYNFSVSRTGTGTYLIRFSPAFTNLPAITGAQWGFGTGQNTRDNVIFPLLSANQTTVFTGDASGDRSDRSFSFIAIGIVNVAP